MAPLPTLPRSIVGLLIIMGLAIPPTEAQEIDERLQELEPDEDEQVPGVPPPSLQERFDELEAIRDAGDFQRIMEELEALLEQYPDNGEVLWRLARTRTDVAERTTEEEERSRELLFQAHEEAQRAVELLPEHSFAHLTKSVTAGRAALVASTRQQIELSRTMREYADKAIELDPENDLAYHLRGRWHYEVAGLGFVSRNVVRIVYGGLPDASYRQAEADYRRAIELQERVVHRFELGRTLKEIGNRHGARAQFERVLSLPQEDVTDPIYKERAEELLQRL